jgi:hypothetical protein
VQLSSMMVGQNPVLARARNSQNCQECMEGD